MFAQTGGGPGRGRSRHDKTSSDEAKKLRVLGGRYLKGLREAAELTQRELADLVGIEYYTFISQIENGHGRPPPDAYHKWAEALKVDLFDFVKRIMKFYDPYTYAAIFQSKHNYGKFSDEQEGQDASRVRVRIRDRKD